MGQIRRHIKRNAKAALYSKWGITIAGFLVIVAVFVLISTTMEFLLFIFNRNIFNENDIDFNKIIEYDPITTAIVFFTLFLELLLLVPLWMGLKRMCYNAATANNAKFNDLYKNLARFRAVKIFVYVWLSFIVAVAILLIPSALLTWLTENVKNNNYNIPGADILLYTAIVVFTIFAVILAFLFTRRYFLAPYLLYENPEWKASQCLKTSVKIMKERKQEVLSFNLSFIPLLLCGLLIIPLIFIIPYMQTSLSIYAKYLIEATPAAFAATPSEQGAIEVVKDRRI